MFYCLFLKKVGSKIGCGPRRSVCRLEESPKRECVGRRSYRHEPSRGAFASPWNPWQTVRTPPQALRQLGLIKMGPLAPNKHFQSRNSEELSLEIDALLSNKKARKSEYGGVSVFQVAACFDGGSRETKSKTVIWGDPLEKNPGHPYLDEPLKHSAPLWWFAA